MGWQWHAQSAWWKYVWRYKSGDTGRHRETQGGTSSPPRAGPHTATSPHSVLCTAGLSQHNYLYFTDKVGPGLAGRIRNNLRDSELLSSTEQLHMSYSFYFLNLFVSSEDDDICSLKHKYSIFIIHIQLHKFWRYHGIVGWLFGNINKLILWPKNWMNSVDYFR